MTFKAKPVLKDKFWIVENNGHNVGTLSVSDDHYLYTCDTGTRMYPTEKSLAKALGSKIYWSEGKITDSEGQEKFAYEYPTSCLPYNIVYDVKNKLPLFTKSNKSKSLYCAGYYIIRFDKGWVKSFCPKLITLERYEYKGPFKTDIEMRQELSNATKSAS